MGSLLQALGNNSLAISFQMIIDEKWTGSELIHAVTDLALKVDATYPSW